MALKFAKPVILTFLLSPLVLTVEQWFNKMPHFAVNVEAH
jgi:hypothetical protein